ncbi:MAG TPA: metal ABC transporter permease [Acidimicrobiales bacterium]|nr:metal ABC transporter permease [Acidimicrobiales bacterium]
MSSVVANVVFGPGFFSSGPVHVALLAGGVVALMSGVVGVFTVVRGQSFAGHAFSDMDTTGGSGALLLGIGTLWGFLVVAIAAAGAMELLGVERRRGRDVATGVVLGAALGLAALFLYWDTTVSSTTGATTTVLFGSLFTISGSTLPATVAFSAVVLAAALVLYRPLLFSSFNADMARVRGVPVRALGAVFMVMLALAVALSALTVGAILSTALLIGPAATALRLTKRPGAATGMAAGIGLLGVWSGILFAYDSSAWPGHHGWPVSFSVVAVIFALYLVADLQSRVRSRWTRARQNRPAVEGD